jgi:hypothetical protein
LSKTIIINLFKSQWHALTPRIVPGAKLIYILSSHTMILDVMATLDGRESNTTSFRLYIGDIMSTTSRYNMMERHVYSVAGSRVWGINLTFVERGAIILCYLIIITHHFMCCIVVTGPGHRGTGGPPPRAP